MTLKEYAKMLGNRTYKNEITKEEENLAKKLGFVVVFGYSDDNAELRGAIDDEIGCFDGGILEHKNLPSPIYADWCPQHSECAWAYRTTLPHETFNIYDEDGLYCIGIVCDINKPKQTNADRIRAMSDEQLAKLFMDFAVNCYNDCGVSAEIIATDYVMEWLKQPAEGD